MESPGFPMTYPVQRVWPDMQAGKGGIKQATPPGTQPFLSGDEQGSLGSWLTTDESFQNSLQTGSSCISVYLAAQHPEICSVPGCIHNLQNKLCKDKKLEI